MGKKEEVINHKGTEGTEEEGRRKKETSLLAIP
jgi:hypothetical protein